jgi:hypothetical protein
VATWRLLLQRKPSPSAIVTKFHPCKDRLSPFELRLQTLKIKANSGRIFGVQLRGISRLVESLQRYNQGGSRFLGLRRNLP